MFVFKVCTLFPLNLLFKYFIKELIFLLMFQSVRLMFQNLLIV